MTLKTELSRDVYAGLTDDAAAAALNALPAATVQRVAVRDLMDALFANGIYGKLEIGERKASTLSDEAFAALRTLLAMRTTPLSDLDISGQEFNRMLNLLVQANVVTGADRTTLRPLANVQPPSRAQELGLGTVTAAQVANARAEIVADEVKAGNAVAFDALRGRVAAGYGRTLAWLNEQQAAGANVPGYAEVVARLQEG